MPSDFCGGQRETCRRIKEKEGIDPEAVETVKKNMYVDDLMKSTDTIQKSI